MIPMSVKKSIATFDEKQVEKLIAKGALVKEDVKPVDQKTHVHLNLRMPQFLLNRLDEVVSNRIGMSRNAWIVEAINEKIKRNCLDVE